MGKPTSESQATGSGPVTVQSIEIIPEGVAEGHKLPQPVRIAAGAVESGAHRATVVIQVDPKEAGIPLEISLLNGRGHEPGKSARLVIGETTIPGGGPPMTVKTKTGGRIEGVLTSSDVLETCTVHTSTLDRDVEFTWDMAEDSEWTVDPPYLPVPGVLTNYLTLVHRRHGGRDAPWTPVDQHEIYFAVESVEYRDQRGQVREALNTASSPGDLSAWAHFRETPVTTGRDGKAQAALVIHNRPNLLSVSLAIHDQSVWRATAPLLAPSSEDKPADLAREPLTHKSHYHPGRIASGDVFQAKHEPPPRLQTPGPKEEDARQQNTELKRLRKDLQQQKAKLERSNTECRAHRESMAKALSEKDAAISTAERERDAANIALPRLKEKLDNATAQLRLREDEIGKLQKQLASLKKKETKHKQQATRLKKLESNLTRLEEGTTELLEISGQTQQRISDNTGKAKLLQTRMADAMERLTRIAEDTEDE